MIARLLFGSLGFSLPLVYNHLGVGYYFIYPLSSPRRTSKGGRAVDLI